MSVKCDATECDYNRYIMGEVVVRRAAGLILYRRKANSEVEFLLLKASYAKQHWSPPKGHVQPGEDDVTTALRETREECGVEETDVRFDDGRFELSYPVKGRRKEVVYFPAQLLRPDREIVLSDEHTDYAWLGVEAACDTVGFPDLQRVLRQLHSSLVRSS